VSSDCAVCAISLPEVLPPLYIPVHPHAFDVPMCPRAVHASPCCIHPHSFTHPYILALTVSVPIHASPPIHVFPHLTSRLRVRTRVSPPNPASPHVSTRFHTQPRNLCPLTRVSAPIHASSHASPCPSPSQRVSSIFSFQTRADSHRVEFPVTSVAPSIRAPAHPSHTCSCLVPTPAFTAEMDPVDMFQQVLMHPRARRYRPIH